MVGAEERKEYNAADILKEVYAALSKKGYDPVSQVVGYIMSGDPSYVTNYHGARNLITKVDREELLEEIMTEYMREAPWEK